MKLRNFESANGKTVANQFIITDGSREIFQSYKTVIAIKQDGKIILDSKFWDYSKTTAKYRNRFLSETTQETKRKINAGIYELANLN